MNRICTYDVQQINTRLLLKRVAELVPERRSQDWSDGRHFPWWVWLANTGAIRSTVDGGIFTFVVYNIWDSDQLVIGILSTESRYAITFPSGKKLKVCKIY